MINNNKIVLAIARKFIKLDILLVKKSPSSSDSSESLSGSMK